MTLENIIIIDDDEPFRRVLTRSLQRLGFSAHHFAKPESALNDIQQMDNLAILLDLKLESDSGLRWIKTIREHNKECQLVLLTGFASISTAVEAIKLGADDYLTKPTTAREIISHLKQATIKPQEIISDKPMSVERLEWEHIQKVLSDNEGNISATARALNMHRRTLQRKLAKRPVKN